MKYFSKSVKGKGGFTIIEILVVTAILIVIISFGVTADFSSFTSDTFQAEESKIVSLLQRARSKAMSNMYDTTHGMCYNSGNYIIFRARTDCLPTHSTDELIPANTNITINFPTIVFGRLTGNLTPSYSGTDAPCLPDEKKISLDYQGRTANICINNEGRINW